MKFYNSNVKKGSFPFPVNDGNRGARAVEGIPETVLKVTSVREMGRFWIIAKENEGRRFDGNLVGEKDFETAVVEVRSWVHVLGVHNNLIKDVGRNPPVKALIGLGDRRKNLVDPLPCLSADEENRRVVEELKLVVDIVDEFLLVEFLRFA